MVGIFRESKIQNVHWLKISLFVQTGEEMQKNRSALMTPYINPSEKDLVRKRYDPSQF